MIKKFFRQHEYESVDSETGRALKCMSKEDFMEEVAIAENAFASGRYREVNEVFDELENAQAALSVEQDMKDTAERLSYMAGSLKLCDDPELQRLGY